MIKIFKFIFFMLIVSFPLSCNWIIGTTFNATVFDENQQPVQNAEIKGGCGNGGFDGKTDETGRFSVSVQCALDEGFHFAIKKEGFLEYSEAVRPLDLDDYKQFKDKKVILKK